MDYFFKKKMAEKEQGKIEVEQEPISKIPSTENASTQLLNGDLSNKILESLTIKQDVIFEEYESLENELQELNVLDNIPYINALDRAEYNTRKAFKIWLSYQKIIEEAKLESESVLSKIREEALRYLQRQKDSGRRNKSITNADVENAAFALYRNDVEFIRGRKKSFELVEMNLKNLHEVWVSRTRTLQVLVNKR